VVEEVAIKVNGAAEHGLGTVSALRGVDSPVVENADIVDAAIGLDEVVVEHVQVVFVDGRWRRRGGPDQFGCAVGGDADAVVEIGDGVPGDDVTGAVNFNRVIAGDEV
jgi:hypothetical protein